MIITKTDCGFDCWTVEVDDLFVLRLYYSSPTYKLTSSFYDASAEDFRKLANMFNYVADLKEKAK